MKWVLVIIVLGIILFLGNSFFIESEPVEVKPQQSQQSQQSEEESISVILVGDIMLARGVEYMIEKMGDGDFRFPFLKIADDLKEAKRGARPRREGGGRVGVLFGNLEGPISDKGTKVGSIYSFRAEPEAIEGLTFAGFDILSLANNHAFDYTGEALEDCLTRLSKAGISYVGAGFTENEAYSPVIKEIDGPADSPQVKIAFLAYTNLGPETWRATEENSGIAWISKDNFEKIKKDIENAKSQADILVVSLHSGEEYQKTPTQFQIEFSKMAIDAGADLVVGHHPHVIQPNEKYGNGYIFYSLGNFIFDQSFSSETMQGLLLEVIIENKKIKEIIPKEIKLNNYFQPRLEIFDTQILPKE